MPSSPPISTLVDLPNSRLWWSRSWPEIAGLKTPGRHLAMLPLFGFADWGLGRPLDLEETIGCGVLRATIATESPILTSLTILPPLRFVLGPYPHCCFGLDFETACDLVRDIASSVRASGLSRLVFFNTSPWNEEFVATCACDLRVEFGLQTSVVHLGALGLDLHPTRSSTRSAVQAAACALTRRPPANDAPRADIRLADFRPGDIRQPHGLPFKRSLDASIADGWTALVDAGGRLARLLSEIQARPPLAGGGAIPTMRASPKPSRKTKLPSPRLAAPRRRRSAR